jgi:hypothetical protein
VCSSRKDKLEVLFFLIVPLGRKQKTSTFNISEMTHYLCLHPAMVPDEEVYYIVEFYEQL